MYYITYNENNRNQWQSKLIDCYKSIYNTSPWNENWQTDKQVVEALQQYTADNCQIILAIANNDVVGFVWGAVWSDCQRSVEPTLKLPNTNADSLGYVKDIGVRSEFRQQGISKALVKKLTRGVMDLYCKGFGSETLRIVYCWFPNVIFNTVDQYPVTSRRAGKVALTIHSIK